MKSFEIELLTIFIVQFYSTLSHARFIIIYIDSISSLYQSRLIEGTSTPDPLINFTLEQRQATCDEVILAKTYTRLQIAVQLPPDETAVVDLNIENYQRYGVLHPDIIKIVPLEYESGIVPLHVGPGIRPTINVFPCVNETDRKLYVTYGLRENQMFLVEEKLTKGNRNYPMMKLVALIEPIPSFCVQNPISFETYFMSQLVSDFYNLERTVPDSMTLAEFNKVEHLRLCSTIFEAMVEQGYFEEDIRSHKNYVRARFYKPRKKRLRVGVYPNVHVIVANVMSCSINRDVNYPQFHILADTKKEGAAFIFMDVLRTEDKIGLVGQAENVSILLESIHNVATSGA